MKYLKSKMESLIFILTLQLVALSIHKTNAQDELTVGEKYLLQNGKPTFINGANYSPSTGWFQILDNWIAGSGLNQFDLAWNPIPAINIKRTWNAEREGEKPADPTETTWYGHNTEPVWLMVRALDAAKESKEPTNLFSNCCSIMQ